LPPSPPQNAPIRPFTALFESCEGSYTERDDCGSRDLTNKKVLDFINALLNDVKDVANDLNVPIRIYSDYQLLKKNLSFLLVHRFCHKTYAFYPYYPKLEDI